MASIGRVREFKVNGIRYPAKPGWTINTGRPLREGIPGDDTTHGFTETAQVPFFEGPLTITKDVSVVELLGYVDATVTLRMGDGKRYILRGAWWAGPGEISTDAGEVTARFEGLECDIDE